MIPLDPDIKLRADEFLLMVDRLSIRNVDGPLHWAVHSGNMGEDLVFWPGTRQTYAHRISVLNGWMVHVVYVLLSLAKCVDPCNPTSTKHIAIKSKFNHCSNRENVVRNF